MLLTATIALGVSTAITAIIAALYWFKSATLSPQTATEPIAAIADNPVLHTLTDRANENNIRHALNESAKLNKSAAVWTGVSALFSAATTFAGMFH